MRSILSVMMMLIAMPLIIAADDARPVKRPNFVIFLMDDMGYGDITPFNPKCRNRTPQLARMSSEGMRLTSFYAAPVCTPSRAQLLTGCYAKRVSLPDVIFPASPIGLSDDEHTIAGLLHPLGYASMCIGKWHVGDQPEFLPDRRGFDHYLGIPYSNDMGGEWDGTEGSAGRKFPPLPFVRDGKIVETLKPSDQDLVTGRYTDAALAFIRDHRAGPFFLYLAHTAVHVPIHPGPAFRGKSANGAYGDWVEEADDSAGRVLATLRELGIADDTLVIFTSDNGPWLIQGKDGGEAGPLRGGKGSTYEGGMREPTIAWWPGHIPAGSACDAVAGNIDLLPTLVGLAGGSVPADRRIDGCDLAPLLLGTAKESPHQAYYYFSSTHLQALRSGPWKLVITHQNERRTRDKKPETGPFTPRLYNLDEDIGETKDVSADFPAQVERLRAFATTMDDDLGIDRKGPGVRPPGRVAQPKPLLLKP